MGHPPPVPLSSLPPSVSFTVGEANSGAKKGAPHPQLVKDPQCAKEGWTPPPAPYPGPAPPTQQGKAGPIGGLGAFWARLHIGRGSGSEMQNSGVFSM